MREALNRWLKKQGVDLAVDTAHSLCDSLGLDGEKIDSCLGLCYQLEKGEINEADFTGGLCVLTSKKPEEVAKILKNIGTGQQPAVGKDNPNSAIEIKRYHGFIVQVGDVKVKTLLLPDWSLEYIEFPQGEMPEYRSALMKEHIKITKVTDRRIYFE